MPTLVIVGEQGPPFWPTAAGWPTPSSTGGWRSSPTAATAPVRVAPAWWGAVGLLAEAADDDAQRL
jgi:hypothetical protein